MALSFRKFISEVFVNGKFPKILPSENFPLYGIILTKLSCKCLPRENISVCCKYLCIYGYHDR